MIKWLSMILFALCCSLDVQAVMVQRSSDALSYRNVAKSYTSKPNVQANRNKKSNKSVNLKSAVSGSVHLYKGDTLTVEVSEDSCCTFDVEYDNGIFSFSDRGKKNEVHTFVFGLHSSEKCSSSKGSIYIDIKDKTSNKTKQNKAVYVTCN